MTYRVYDHLEPELRGRPRIDDLSEFCPPGIREWDGYVYFVQGCASPRLIKIGWTNLGPNERLEGLRSESPVPVKPLAVLKATMWDERLAHAAFKDFRHHNEWFHSFPPLVQFIKEWGRPWPETHRRLGDCYLETDEPDFGPTLFERCELDKNGDPIVFGKRRTYSKAWLFGLEPITDQVPV